MTYWIWGGEYYYNPTASSYGFRWINTSTPERKLLKKIFKKSVIRKLKLSNYNNLTKSD